MWLKKIELKNFKRFSNLSLRFTPGINIVKGSLNEIGKSTLLEGIIAALFYNPKSNAKQLEGYISWGSARRYETTLEFEESENSFLLQKNFQNGTIKLLDHNTGEELNTFKDVSRKLEDLLGTDSDRLFICTSCIRQDQVSEIKSGREEISNSLEEAVTGGEEDVLASQVLQKLDDKVSESKKGLDRPVKFPGILAALKTKIEFASQRYKEINNEVEEVEAKKIKLMETNKKLAQIEGEYESSSALLEKNKKRREIKSSIAALEQKYNEVEKLVRETNVLTEKFKEAGEALESIEGFENEAQVSEVRKQLDKIEVKRGTLINDLASLRGKLKTEDRRTDLKNKCKQAEQELKSIEGFETKQKVSEFHRNLMALQIRKGDIEQDITKREEEINEAKEKLAKRRVIRFLGSRQSIACAAAVFTGGIVGVIISSVYFLSLIILGVAFLAAITRARGTLTPQKTRVSDLKERIQRMKESLGELEKERDNQLTEAKCNTIGEFDEKERNFYYWFEQGEEIQKQLNIEEAKIADLEQRIQKMEEAVEELKVQEGRLLAGIKCNTVEEFEEKERKFWHWKGKQHEYENQLKGKLGTRNIEEIERERIEIARNLAVEQAKITEDMESTVLSPEKYIELESKVKNLEEERKEVEERKNRYEAAIEVARFDAEARIKVEEELENLQRDLRREEYKVKIYELTREFMSRARQEAFSAANEVLESETQKYFSNFTNGKYEQVKVGKENLEFWIYSKEKGDWVKPEELSGGVIDEFYLAYRLALVKLIFGKKTPPLILDDPFGNFDSVRLNKALLLFRNLSEDYQIIIFTLKDIYDEVADNIALLN